jgi:hypothetical protein
MTKHIFNLFFHRHLIPTCNIIQILSKVKSFDNRPYTDFVMTGKYFEIGKMISNDIEYLL